MRLLVQHPATCDEAANDAAARALVPRGAALAGEVILPSPTMTPMRRMDVYNGGYLSRLVEVLESDYEVLRYALGDAWLPLAREYVYAHPSHHPNLNGFGHRLPEFVAGRDHPHQAFLTDLARLQWAMVETFDAAEFTPLDFNELQTLSPEQWAGVKLRANPSVHVMEFDHPANRYLQDRFDGGEPTIPEPQPSRVLLNRVDGRVWRTELPEPIHRVLSALVEGAPFGPALEAGVEHDQDVTVWFREWSADGVFVAAEIPA